MCAMLDMHHRTTVLYDMCTRQTICHSEENVMSSQLPSKEEILTPEAIKSWREEKGFSQRQLAVMLGVGEVTIARWESKNSNQRPTGTAATILATLISGQAIKEDNTKKEVIALISAGGALFAGYAIWKALNEIFNE